MVVVVRCDPKPSSGSQELKREEKAEATASDAL